VLSGTGPSESVARYVFTPPFLTAPTFQPSGMPGQLCLRGVPNIRKHFRSSEAARRDEGERRLNALSLRSSGFDYPEVINMVEFKVRISNGGGVGGDDYYLTYRRKNGIR
jgi:hypothetical protein